MRDRFGMAWPDPKNPRPRPTYPPGYPKVMTDLPPGPYLGPPVDDFADDPSDPRYPHPERRTTT